MRSATYLNAEFGGLPPARRANGAARWRALATIAIASGVLEAQIMRRAETACAQTRNDRTTSSPRCATAQLRCLAALERQLPTFGETFDLAQITTAVACGYDDWRYGPDWRGAAPELAEWYDSFAGRASMKATHPAETPQRSRRPLRSDYTFSTLRKRVPSNLLVGS